MVPLVASHVSPSLSSSRGMGAAPGASTLELWVRSAGSAITKKPLPATGSQSGGTAVVATVGPGASVVAAVAPSPSLRCSSQPSAKPTTTATAAAASASGHARPAGEPAGARRGGTGRSSGDRWGRGP